jgi:GntR family transcriptional regulator/GntR family frlABCD operon transcriptional regulator
MRQEETIPLYKKLIDDLRKSIDDGKYKKGELLPSENDLCRTYHTTRPTVRQALAGLTNLGYIIRQQGKGSIVSEQKRGLGILSVSGVTAGVGNQNLKTLILKKPTKQGWPYILLPDLTEEEKDAGCIYFTRVRYINNVPVLYEETFITDIHLPRFTSRNLENRSFLKLLNEQYQIEVVGGEQKIWAISAGKTIGKLLTLRMNSPIVHMKRKLKTNVKDLNIYSWLFCNTENHFLHDLF